MLVIDQSEYIEDRPVPGPFPAFPMTKREKPWERGWHVLKPGRWTGRWTMDDGLDDGRPSSRF